MAAAAAEEGEASKWPSPKRPKARWHRLAGREERAAAAETRTRPSMPCQRVAEESELVRIEERIAGKRIRPPHPHRRSSVSFLLLGAGCDPSRWEREGQCPSLRKPKIPAGCRRRCGCRERRSDVPRGADNRLLPPCLACLAAATIHSLGRQPTTPLAAWSSARLWRVAPRSGCEVLEGRGVSVSRNDPSLARCRLRCARLFATSICSAIAAASCFGLCTACMARFLIGP